MGSFCNSDNNGNFANYTAEFRRATIVTSNDPCNISNEAMSDYEEFTKRTSSKYRGSHDLSARTVLAHRLRLQPRGVRPTSVAVQHPIVTTTPPLVGPSGPTQAESGPTPPAFDRYGNANYDASGTYTGGHGVGTMVDNPDASTMGIPKADMPDMSSMHCTGSTAQRWHDELQQQLNASLLMSPQNRLVRPIGQSPEPRSNAQAALHDGSDNSHNRRILQLFGRPQLEQSCTHITAEGYTVHALCRNSSGAMAPALIDVRGCSATSQTWTATWSAPAAGEVCQGVSAAGCPAIALHGPGDTGLRRLLGCLPGWQASVLQTGRSGLVRIRRAAGKGQMRVRMTGRKARGPFRSFLARPWSRKFGWTQHQRERGR